MITVAFLNQKGGVGKSSLCHHLAGALADAVDSAGEGLSVLIADLDPQASATQGLLGPDEAAALPADLTTASILAGHGPDPRDLIRAIDRPGRRVALLPSSIDLAAFNLANPFETPAADAIDQFLARMIVARPDIEHAVRELLAVNAARQSRLPARGHLRHFLAEAAQEFGFDYCLVDCPPNLSTCAAQALSAADFLVIPTMAEDYGAQGLGPVLEFLGRSAAEDNPYVKLAGVVVNNRERRSLHAAYEKRLRDHQGRRVFAAVVPHLVGYAEAISYRLPITWHDPGSNAASAMRELAAEFLERTGGGPR